MDRDNFVISLILRARDQMGPAMTAANRHLRDFRGNLDRTRNDMRKFDQDTDTTTRGLGRLGSRLDQVRGKVNAIRGPTDSAGRSLRNLRRDSDGLSGSFARLDRRVHQNRESIAKFDNELRGMRILFIASQMQALTTAVIGLGDQLVALAGSAGVAATAIGGTLVAAVAQAIPAIGLLAATIFRVKQVTDVLQQIQLAQKQSASQATSATNKQADSVDKLTTANESLMDAQRGVQEAHRGVSQAIADQKRELEDLILAQRAASLQEEESVDRLRQLRSTGTTGFELRGAELDVSESRVRTRRSREDLTAARTGTPEGVRTALRQLDDSERALARARRGLGNAQRDSQEAGIANVAAARQLQFLRKQLSDSENALVDSVGRLRATWKKVARPVTDIIIDSFTRATDEAEKAIQRPGLIKAFENLATKASRQIDRITGFAFSDRSIGFLERTTKRLADNLQPAGTAAIRLARAFMNISDAAAPILHRLIEDFAQFTGRIERFTQDRDRLREIFEFGEQQLHVWLRLAGAIGRLIIALIAPGGNAGFGAAVSGARTIARLTERIEDAIRWINDNPTKVGEHFADSEQIFERILDLLVEIGRVMFDLFDPQTVDTFASAVELILPAFAQAAQTFGFFTEKIVAFLSLPGIKEIFQTGFGLVIFLRLGGRFKALFTGLLGDLTGLIRRLFTAQARIEGMVTTTGGLVTRWRAGKVAVDAYTISVERAAVATAEANALAAESMLAGRSRGAAPRANLPPNYFYQRDAQGRVRNPAGRYVPERFAPPVATTSGGAVGGVGGLAVATRLLGAAKFIGGIAAFTAILTGLTTPGGPMEKFGAAIESATFGLVKLPERRDPTAAQRDRNRAAGQDNAFIFGGAREQRGILAAIESGDIDKLRHYRHELRLTREEMVHFGDESGARRAAQQIKAITEAIRGVENRPLFHQALDRIKELREQGVDNLKQLRDQMRITFTFITESARKGSDNWRIAMVSNMQAGVSSVLDAVKDERIGVKAGMEEITRITRRQMRLIKGHMQDLSGEARDALSENFRTARIRAERQLGSLETATGRSLQVLKRLMANELASYGFSSTEVRRIIRAKQDPEDFSRGSRSTEGTSKGPLQTNARGGFIGRPMGGFIGAMGERGQDAIHTMLGRGEAVLNWGQQKIVEPALNAAYGFGLTDLFKKTKGFHAGTGTGGYARGGIPIVPVPGFPGEQANRAILDEIAFVTKRFGLRLTDAYGPGHQSPGHTIYGTAADFSGPDRSMNAAVKFLASRYKVLYDGRFGSTAWPGHGPSTVAGSNAHLHVEFGTKDLAAATGNAKPFAIPRVEVIGAGTVGEIANAGLAQVRRGILRAARRAIRRSLTAGTEGSEIGAGPAPPGQLRSWLRRALQITHHMSPGNLNALYGRAMQESSGDPGAINNWDTNARAGHPSQGLLQTIPSTFATYSLPGMKNILNPIHNAVAAIRYMYATYGHIVGPSSSGYAAGGELPGPLGRAKMIMAHGKEWILNEGQKSKVAGWLGTSVGGLRDRLGFTGGPTEYQGGGEVAKDRNFDLPDILPRTFGGTSALIGRIIKFIAKFGNVNANIDILTRENGLIDQLGTQLEETTSRMETAIIRGTFRVKNGEVVRRHSDIWISQETLDALETTGRQLRRVDRAITRGLRAINRRIANLRAGGVTDRERGILLDLVPQRRNLLTRREAIRRGRAENLQTRFEQQENLEQLRRDRFQNAVDRNFRPFERGLATLDFQQRMAQVLGAVGLGGGQAGIFASRGNLLTGQLGEAGRLRDIAARDGNTEAVDNLNDKIQELQLAIAENTSALFEARVADVNDAQQRVNQAAATRIRILELQRELGITTPADAQAAIRNQIGIQRDALISQRGGLTGLLNDATAAGNETQINALNQQLLDNELALLENTQSLKELDGSLAETQSFSSTAWQWYRTAVFNGSGGLLENFTPPIGFAGLPMPTTTGTWGPGGGGGGTYQKVVGVENMEITQNETVDYVYLGNKIAWDVNTPTT